MLYGVGEVIGFLEVAVISVMCCGHVSCLWSVRLEEMLKMTAKENKTNLGVGGSSCSSSKSSRTSKSSMTSKSSRTSGTGKTSRAGRTGKSSRTSRASMTGKSGNSNNS